VISVGEQVSGWRVGARATAPFVCACGACPTCLRGDGQVCERQTQPGFTHWGSFAEQVVVRNAMVNLVALPEELSFPMAASLGCRYATAYRAVLGRGHVRAGARVAVHGCGGVGLSAVMIAAAAGAEVIAVDTSPAARALALEFGARHALDPAEAPVVPRVRALTSGGADVSLDALGDGGTLLDSVRCLRPRGTHVQVGLLGGQPTVPAGVLATAIAGELQLLGSHGMAAADYPAMLARIASGELTPQRLVRTTIGLADIPAELAASGERAGDGIVVAELG
jgi:D-arabinose 1-dehydrogenase-like Zn-dependent alcohol dehydrogenase